MLSLDKLNTTKKKVNHGILTRLEKEKIKNTIYTREKMNYQKNINNWLKITISLKTTKKSRNFITSITHVLITSGSRHQRNYSFQLFGEV